MYMAGARAGRNPFMRRENTLARTFEEERGTMYTWLTTPSYQATHRVSTLFHFLTRESHLVEVYML
jgi:hypothetical protein